MVRNGEGEGEDGGKGFVCKRLSVTMKCTANIFGFRIKTESLRTDLESDWIDARLK